MTTPRSIAQQCRWCGHRLHDDTCTRTITTRINNKPAEAPCPCTRHLKERTP